MSDDRGPTLDEELNEMLANLAVPDWQALRSAISRVRGGPVQTALQLIAKLLAERERSERLLPPNLPDS